MELISFRVKNYKSIIDSKECYLSVDGITILAGQNESGKTSILEALLDFDNGKYNREAKRDDESIISVSAKYSVDKEEFYKYFKSYSDEDIKSDYPLISILIKDKKIIDINKSIELIEFERVESTEEDDSVLIVGEAYDKYSDAIDKWLEENGNGVGEKDLMLASLSEALWYKTPSISFFSDFLSILPDKIFIADIIKLTKVNGLDAVKSLQTLLGVKFSDLLKKSDAKVEIAQEEYEYKISKDFNSKWRQRTGDSKGVTISVRYYQGNDNDGPYLRFYIQTRVGEKLAPERRSQGFKWFLSFYLQLMADNIRNKNIIIMLDEPGLHLHSKAQADMLNLLEDLALKNQIIYSTHSPYLIHSDKLHRVKLIFNSSKSGTTIEKITTKLSVQQKDALKPVIDALGLEVVHSFSPVKKNNVILEGISDYYYMIAFKDLMNEKADVSFIPSMGVSNISLLVSLCIGWGLDWITIFDEEGSTSEINKIKKYFSEDECDNKIFVINGCKGIEDIFQESDIKLAVPDFCLDNDNMSKAVGKFGGKELVARLFLSKVKSKEILIGSISGEAKQHMKEIFEFINCNFASKK